MAPNERPFSLSSFCSTQAPYIRDAITIRGAMTFGNLMGARKYVNKVFDIEAKLGGLTDGRNSPSVPFAPVMATWFWALTKRLSSTEQVGDLLRDPRWQKRVGKNHWFQRIGAYLPL